MVGLDTPIKKVPEMSFLGSAKVHFCISHVYNEYRGFNSAIWWRDSDGLTKFKVMETGDTIEYKKPEVIIDTTVENIELDNLLGEYNRLGGDKFVSQTKRYAFHHYDVYIGVKCKSDEEAHWFYILGGEPIDKKVEALINFIDKIYPEWSD